MTSSKTIYLNHDLIELAGGGELPTFLSVPVGELVGKSLEFEIAHTIISAAGTGANAFYLRVYVNDEYRMRFAIDVVSSATTGYNPSRLWSMTLSGYAIGDTAIVLTPSCASVYSASSYFYQTYSAADDLILQRTDTVSFALESSFSASSDLIQLIKVDLNAADTVLFKLDAPIEIVTGAAILPTTYIALAALPEEAAGGLVDMMVSGIFAGDGRIVNMMGVYGVPTGVLAGFWMQQAIGYTGASTRKYSRRWLQALTPTRKPILPTPGTVNINMASFGENTGAVATAVDVPPSHFGLRIGASTDQHNMFITECVIKLRR